MYRRESEWARFYYLQGLFACMQLCCTYPDLTTNGYQTDIKQSNQQILFIVLFSLQNGKERGKETFPQSSVDKIKCDFPLQSWRYNCVVWSYNWKGEDFKLKIMLPKIRISRCIPSAFGNPQFIQKSRKVTKSRDSKEVLQMKYKGNGNMRGKRLKSATASVICFTELSRRELKIENRLHLSEVLHL